MPKYIPSRNCFSQFSVPLLFISAFCLSFGKGSRIVWLSCLLRRLSMNEIIISHEIFSSENKNIIATSIFITRKTSRNNFISIFMLFVSFLGGVQLAALSLVRSAETRQNKWKLLLRRNFYYLVIRYVLLGSIANTQHYDNFISKIFFFFAFFSYVRTCRYRSVLSAYDVIRMGYRRDIFINENIIESPLEVSSRNQYDRRYITLPLLG